MSAPVALLDLDGTLTDPWDGITPSVSSAVTGLDTAGVERAVARLSAAGVRLAVATSKPTPFAERVVAHVGLAGLELVGGATLDGTRRRKADVIAFVLEALGASAADAVMVGDRAQDVVGAQAHGMDCVGVRWGYAEPGELEAAGATHLVDTPDELATLLLSA